MMMKTSHRWELTLLVTAAMLMVSLGAGAQGRPWAKLDKGVLTFTFGAKPAVTAGPVKCSNCNKTLANADKFCSNCGTAKPKPSAEVYAVPLAAKDWEDIPWRERTEDVKRVVITPSFKRCTQLRSTFNMFGSMRNLTSITGLENLNTVNVTNMSNMFSGCISLTSLNVSGFNTSKVTEMNYMFYECEKLTSLNLSNFNTSKVTEMHSMFDGCKKLTSLNLSNFNTSKVTAMGYMFSDCSGLTSLDVSRFNTSNVMYMNDMFWNCRSLTSLDLSSFNTSNVTDMNAMFASCPSLKTITVSSTTWDLSKAKVSKNIIGRPATKDMFRGCPAQIIKK